MTQSPLTTLKQLAARLQEQSLDVANLRTALDVQFKRIAQIQAELDLLPHARMRRALLMAGLPHNRSHNANGRSPTIRTCPMARSRRSLVPHPPADERHRGATTRRFRHGELNVGD